MGEVPVVTAKRQNKKATIKPLTTRKDTLANPLTAESLETNIEKDDELNLKPSAVALTRVLSLDTPDESEWSD